ncbi:MAG: hypothetical protein WCS79_01345 [Paludibacter sp.]
MKKITSIFVSLLFTTSCVLAQGVVPETLKNGLVPSTYNRNALTVIVLDNNGKYMPDIKNACGSLVIPGKYDDNDLNIRYLPASSNPDQILQAIENYKLPNKILAKWFSQQPNGEFDMSLIATRGLYNATAGDMKIASASKTGLNKIKDAGKALVNNSYIQVLDIRNVMSMQEYYDQQDAANRKSAAAAGTVFKPVERTQNGWKGDVVSYLYKINPNAVDTLFDKMWIYEDDNDAVRNEKKYLFENASFGFSFVMTATAVADGTQYNPGQTLAPKVQLTKEQLFAKLLNMSLDVTLLALETKYEPFRVKTSVYAVHPVRAKIGTKEGLSVDQRYFILENEQNNKGEVVSKQKAVVRVSKVAVNSVVAGTASVELSKFYQTAGKRIEPGMTMQQRNDFGLGLSLGGGSLTGGMGGFYMKAEENLAVLTRQVAGPKNPIGVTQLKIFGSYAFDGGNYSNYYNVGDFTFGRYQVGLSKGFYFMRAFSLAPFLAYGVEKATWTNSSTDYNISTAFLNIGAYATINIRHNIQLVGTANYYILVGNAYSEIKNSDNTTTSTDLGFMYDDSYSGFAGRSGLAIDLGLRIEL